VELKVKKYRSHRFSFFQLLHDNIQVFINKDMIEFLSHINLKNKNIIDGGSNVGLHSLYFSRRTGKKGTVHAFEIQPVIYKLGCDNAVMNNKKNIVHYNLALSDKSGESVGFSEIDYTSESVSSGGIRTEAALSGNDHCGSIRTIALDDLDIQNIGLIKLDLEGYEPKALAGMWKSIDRWKPYLIIELSPGYLLDGKDERTIEEIKSHGYSVTEGGSFNYFFEPI